MSDEKRPKRGPFWLSRFRQKPKPEEPKEELKADYVPSPKEEWEIQGRDMSVNAPFVRHPETFGSTSVHPE
jgi:hypothetical protein